MMKTKFCRGIFVRNFLSEFRVKKNHCSLRFAVCVINCWFHFIITGTCSPRSKTERDSLNDERIFAGNHGTSYIGKTDKKVLPLFKRLWIHRNSILDFLSPLSDFISFSSSQIKFVVWFVDLSGFRGKSHSSVKRHFFPQGLHLKYGQPAFVRSLGTDVEKASKNLVTMPITRITSRDPLEQFSDDCRK